MKKYLIVLLLLISAVWLNAQSWDQVIKLVASDRASMAEFGISVSISGDYAIVGACWEAKDASGGNTIYDAGSAYIFYNNSGTWEEMQKVVASDRAESDNFGISVSIAGDYAIVGAYCKSEDVSGGNTIYDAGSAYIFYNNSGTWEEVQKIVASDRAADDRFGYSVSISGDYAIVGACYEDEDASGGSTKYDAGSAYIFYNNAGTWEEVQKIVASDRAADDRFGFSVSISGDYAIVGSNCEDEDLSGGNYASEAGSAYIFYNNAGTWEEAQKIVASDRDAGDWFGIRVSISGDYAIVGACYEDEDASGHNTESGAGSAYIFYNNAGTWEEAQKIVASDRDAGDWFGISVSISGDYAIVGANYEAHNTAGGAGSAYIFYNNSGTWEEAQKVVASDRDSGDWFGISVSISGGYAIVGADHDGEDASGDNHIFEAGSAYLFYNQAAQCVDGNSTAVSTIDEVVFWGCDTVNVESDVTITDNGVLTIDPGTVVRFKGDYGIFVQGTGRLLAEGAVNDTIYFDADYDTDGSYGENFGSDGGEEWKGIRFGDTESAAAMNASADSSIISCCKITHAFANQTGNGNNGGAVYVEGFNKLLLTGNIIANNRALGNGGGINNLNSSPEIINNIITSNTSSSSGGGIYSQNSTPEIINCVITNNTASYYGGGILCYNSPAYLINNTICKNSDGNNTGGAFFDTNSNVTIVNTIFWGNSGNQLGYRSGSVIKLNYCAVQGGYEGTGNINLSVNNTGDSNSPNFTSPDSDNWFLVEPSVCLNSGSPAYNSESPAYPSFLNDDGDYKIRIDATTITDIPELCIDGNSRKSGEDIEIGALENPSALPVELISFFAALVDEGVKLNWETATEVNNYGFEIERNNPPKPSGPTLPGGESEGWEVLGFVEGHGNSNSPKSYEFIDDLSDLAEQSSADSLQYRLKQIDTDGSYAYYGIIAEVNNSVTGINEEELPTEYSLSQNYPNPFNPETTINYSISALTTSFSVGERVSGGQVRVVLKVYDILGGEVATLVNEKQSAGRYSVTFDASSGNRRMASGIYIYRLSAGEFVTSKKLTLMK